MSIKIGMFFRAASIFILLFGWLGLWSAQAEQASFVYDPQGRMDYMIADGDLIDFEYDRSGNLTHRGRLPSLAFSNVTQTLFSVDANFERDRNILGLPEGWSFAGNAELSVDSDASTGVGSQRIQTLSGWGSLYAHTPPLPAGRFFIALVDYKSASNQTVSFRLNDRGSDYETNLGFHPFVNDGVWRTAYIKFQSTGLPVTLIAAYLDVGKHDISVDGVRVYEISSVFYEQIDVDPRWTGTHVADYFGYGDLLDGAGEFKEEHIVGEGIGRDWSFNGTTEPIIYPTFDRPGNAQRFLSSHGNAAFGEIYRTVGKLKVNEPYVFIANYKCQSSNTVSMRVNDTGTNWGINLGGAVFTCDNQWRVASLPFQATVNPITLIPMYADLGIHDVQVSQVRLFHVSPLQYLRIGIDPAYSGEQLHVRYPLRGFGDHMGSFEKDRNYDGLSDGWNLEGSLQSHIDPDATYGDYSQMLETEYGWGSLYRTLDNLPAQHYYLVMLDYKIASNSTVSLRVNDNGLDYGINLGMTYYTNDSVWRTAYMKFSGTGNPITIVAAYADPGTHTIRLDHLRVVKITQDEFTRIDSDPAYSGDQLIARYTE